MLISCDVCAVPGIPGMRLQLVMPRASCLRYLARLAMTRLGEAQTSAVESVWSFISFVLERASCKLLSSSLPPAEEAMHRPINLLFRDFVLAAYYDPAW